MTDRRFSPGAAAALLCAAVAAWASFGALTFVDADRGAGHVGLLPPLGWLAALLAIAVAVAWTGRPSARDAAPLWLSAVLLLPWVPAPLPLSVFIWTGPLAGWLWAAIAAALFLPVIGRRVRPATAAGTMRPRQAALLAGAVAAAVYGLGAWAVAPRHPSGDEPHYLIITQSLLYDHDLQIENNHRQGDYWAYSTVPLKPDYLRRGKNGAIYSVHAPGLPFLIAPVFAVFGYRGVVAALVAASAAASALAWLLAWRVTRDWGASWFAWTAVTLSAPVFFETGAVFPDGVGAIPMAAALLPLADARAREPKWLVLIGAVVATLPWLHARFAFLAASAALVITPRLLDEPRQRFERLAAFFAMPVVSAIAWFAYFQVIYGVPDPAIPYAGIPQTSLANLARGVPGLLFDQQFGLIPNAPAFLCAFGGLLVMLWRGPRRLAIELLVLAAPYWFVVASFTMWWGGYTPPARFLVPVLLPLVIPTAIWFATRRTLAARIAGGGALAVSLLITATTALVDRGMPLFNVRDGASRLVTWLSPAASLITALPSLFQNPPATVVAQACIWLAAIAAAVAIARAVDGGDRTVGDSLEMVPARSGLEAFAGTDTVSVLLVFGLALEATATAAVSFVWASNRANPVTPSSGGSVLLGRYDPETSQIALAYRPFRRLPLAELPQRVILARMPATRSREARERSTSIMHLPPGTYEIGGAVRGSPEGRVRVTTDAQSAPLAEWEVASLGPVWTREIRLPVALEALRIEADRAAAGALHDVVVRAVSVSGRSRRLRAAEARHGGTYGPSAVFLVGGSAYLEQSGIWVGGRAAAQLVIATGRQPVVRLFVRNSPIDNHVTLESGVWREELMLAPREERFVDMPADPAHDGTLLTVHSASGTRPADFDSASEDQRVLGVWIETRER